MLSSYSQTYMFCKLLVSMSNTGSGTTSLSQNSNLKIFDCSSFLINTTFSPTGTINQSNYNQTNSIKFFNITRSLYNNMANYDMGFSSSEIVCINKNAVNSTTCIPPKINTENASHVCHVEMLDIAKYIASVSGASANKTLVSSIGNSQFINFD